MASPRAGVAVLCAAAALGGLPPAAAAVSFSNTLGSHAVLQAGVPNVVWGFTSAGTSVNVSIAGGATYPAVLDVTTGIWRATLPATPATFTPATLTAAASDGSTAVLSDILFGSVYLCR